MHRFAPVLLIALPVMGGCSSSYQPAQSPRIATVMETGTPTLVRDGKSYGGFGFGGGVVDAVQGNPRAEAEARKGRNLVIGGFVLDLAGLGAETAGLVVLSNHDRTAQSTSLGLVLGGLVGVLAGTVLILNGEPHLYDAVNIYNDGVDGPR